MEFERDQRQLETMITKTELEGEIQVRILPAGVSLSLFFATISMYNILDMYSYFKTRSTKKINFHTIDQW